MKQRIEDVNTYIEKERNQLLNHTLYKKINHIQDLKTFTEVHVYAVWDFMSLLKALQMKLTCVQVPWFASTMPNTRYLINEIVLAEESDEYIDGRRLSHFEMYIDAMEKMGADTSFILQFVHDLRQGNSLEKTIQQQVSDYRIQDFLHFTFETIASGEAHQIASIFTFGREDLIPDMFTSILKGMQDKFPQHDMSRFIYYFQRHIDLDGDEHGPLAMQMIEELAGDEEQKWEEIKQKAKQALIKRIALWDCIEERLGK